MGTTSSLKKSDEDKKGLATYVRKDLINHILSKKQKEYFHILEFDNGVEIVNTYLPPDGRWKDAYLESVGIS